MDQRIASFVEKAAMVAHDRKAVQALCRDELKTIDQEYRTDASRKTRLTKYRNALRERGLTKYFLTTMRLPKARACALRTSYVQQVAQKGENQQAISNYSQILARAEQCLESSSYSTVAVGLCLLSGRRPIEICVTGDFSEDSALPDGMVWFSGQAKTRHEAETTDAYAIPLLCSTQVFMTAWKRFLTMKDFSDCDTRLHGPAGSQRFAQQYGHALGEAYQRYFGRLMPAKTTLRNMRDVYGLICFHTRRPGHTAINLYLKQILGHTDTVTAQSYQKFYLDGFDRPMTGE